MFGFAFKNTKTVIEICLIMLGVSLIDIAYPLLSKYAIDHFISQGITNGVGLYAVVYVFCTAFQSICVMLFIIVTHRLEMNMSYDIREAGFKKLQELSVSYYDKTSVGHILSCIISDVARLSEMIAWSITDIMWAIVYIIGCYVSMFTLNYRLALLSLAIIPFIAVASFYFQKRILYWQRKVRSINSKITGSYNEEINGAVTTKTLVREKRNAEEFHILTTDMKRTSIRSAVLSAVFVPSVMLLGSIGTALIINRGSGLVASSVLSFGTLAACISYSTQMFEPIQSIARILSEFQTAQAAAERVLTLLDTEPEITESDDVIKLYGDNFEPKKENWPEIDGKIEFKNVSFHYGNGVKILDDFNLTVEKGENVAVVGATGAGKSTIVNLACRFYEPTEGQILIDGVDYRERSSLWLQSSLGYVLQTPHLFSGTVSDNIRFGNKEASDEDVIAAAKLVGAHDFITELANQYDTDVGEEGALLSTGQKQLISFARVMLKNPKIFVLDEATSSIDTQTEAKIQYAISQTLKGRTSIIIAHRLSTIRSADRILVVDAGKIIEEGSHSVLMSRKGVYYDLYMKQFEMQGEIV